MAGRYSRGSQHSFSQVPSADIPRSQFSRAHGFKTTLDAGYLVPFYVDEVLPGDTFNCNVSVFARLATPIKPLMDNMYLETFFFFVPNRLLWDNWQRFCGEQGNIGPVVTDYVTPVLDTAAQTGGFAVGDLADYFGIPTGVGKLTINAMPFRAYNLIFNEWFRDENLVSALNVAVGDGPDPLTNYALQRRGKRHDYFTSCLPWPQKGPAISMPLGQFAPVIGDGNPIQYIVADATGNNVQQVLTGTTSASADLFTIGFRPVGDTADSVRTSDVHYALSGLRADLSAATAATINELRSAFQLQKMFERDARGGTRYTEILRSHFGVVSPDARLQRPEYLGGGSSPVLVNPVVQTAPSAAAGDTTPQGNLAAYGVVGTDGHGFTKSFVEHGYILGLVNVRGELTYQQGLNRMWSRRSRWDFYWPALSHVGEQAVLNREIYAQGPDVINPTSQRPYDDEVFGYQERWAEYRYFPSLITGEFRSTSGESLDVWHLGQDFADLPVLGETFIQENPPVDRVIATPEEPHFLMDAWFNVKTARPMPTYSVPGLIDHF